MQDAAVLGVAILTQLKLCLQKGLSGGRVTEEDAGPQRMSAPLLSRDYYYTETKETLFNGVYYYRGKGEALKCNSKGFSTSDSFKETFTRQKRANMNVAMDAPVCRNTDRPDHPRFGGLQMDYCLHCVHVIRDYTSGAVTVSVL